MKINNEGQQLLPAGWRLSIQRDDKGEPVLIISGPQVQLVRRHRGGTSAREKYELLDAALKAQA